MSNKPQSMPLKDWLISLTANKLQMDEEHCSTLISWAYNKAKEATLSNTTIEFSGFGKIYANGKKLDRKLENQRLRLYNLLQDDTSLYSEDNLRKHNNIIEEVREYIKYLESKTNENSMEGHPERMAKSIIPTREAEGAHQTDTGGTTLNM